MYAMKRALISDFEDSSGAILMTLAVHVVAHVWCGIAPIELDCTRATMEGSEWRWHCLCGEVELFENEIPLHN